MKRSDRSADPNLLFPKACLELGFPPAAMELPRRGQEGASATRCELAETLQRATDDAIQKTKLESALLCPYFN